MHTFKDESQDLYDAYNSIEPTAFRERVRFYDEHRDLLRDLTEEQFLHLNLDYHLALFEVGKYLKFLKGVDRLVETVIIDRVEVAGRDIFYELLFKKAASLYNMWRLPECETILVQLLHMQSTCADTRELYYQCRCKAQRNWYVLVRGLSILSFLVGLTIIILGQLVIQPFYYEYYSIASTLAVVLISLCVAGLVGSEVMLRLAAVSDLRRATDIAK